LLAGVFAVIQDIRLPFSNFYRTGELVKEIPPSERMVTDYWTMNGLVAYIDKPVYCVDLEKDISFIVWGPEMAVVQNNPIRYTPGLQHLFSKEGLTSVYYLSLNSPQVLSRVDPQLSRTFHVQLIDAREGAIERGSNLYLYKITNNSKAL
jgi:hypothetical protein